MWFEIHEGRDGRWYARVRARNGRILMSSKGYTRRDKAVHCARTVRDGVSPATPICVKEAGEEYEV